jgi:hypothetical protein
LATVLPLLDSEEEKAATIASVEAFKSGDGKILHQHLVEYDAANDNYIEHFVRAKYACYIIIIILTYAIEFFFFIELLLLLLLF